MDKKRRKVVADFSTFVGKDSEDGLTIIDVETLYAGHWIFEKPQAFSEEISAVFALTLGWPTTTMVCIIVLNSQEYARAESCIHPTDKCAFPPMYITYMSERAMENIELP